jgi:hypothetical protein
MRALWLTVLVVLGGCGSLYDTLPDGGFGGGAGGGLSCAADDQCTCDPCATTNECAAGLQCLTAKHKGSACADNRLVCTTGG